VGRLQKEIDQKSNIILQLREQLKGLEANPLPTDEDVEEMARLAEEKDSRIAELEDALRESMIISTKREEVLHQEEKKRKQILEKVSKLEQRLLSLQAAQAMRCHSCRPYVSRMSKLELKLSQLVAERKEHLQELAQMKREALESAISEKDAHLALLEMSGIRSARQADEADRLRTDKRRLVERLKKENELSVSLNETDEDERSFYCFQEEDEAQTDSLDTT
jgi:hypothetical protein